MTERRYDVRNSQTDSLLTTVTCSEGRPAREVRSELIESGLPARISVYRFSRSGLAYDDMARFTHPEEL